MLRGLDWVVVPLSVSLIFIIRSYYEFLQLVRLHRNFPGLRTLLSSVTVAGNLTGPIRGITPGSLWLFNGKHAGFKKFGQDAFLSISIWPAKAVYYVCDAAAIKEIFASRAKFPKALSQYDLLAFFGSNIIVSDFDEWKRFRKIAAPAFSERNNKLVWDVTTRNMIKLFDESWGKQKEVVYDHALEITMDLALFVIAAAGFGRDISWGDDVIPPGHNMSFKAAIHSMSSDLSLKLLFPDFLVRWAPTKTLQRVRDAFDDMEVYMLEMIKERQLSDDKDEHRDLLSNFIAANETEDAKFKLSDRELIANVFIFLIAGHETTGHTLCFVLANLALYQDEQETLFQHIQSVLPDGRVPTYEDMNKLTRCMAVFYETLRMFPATPEIPKMSAEDTTLVVGNEAGEQVTVPIPKGSQINLHVTGLHYNPRYWDDPYAFKPSRFTKDWNKDAFVPFSGGARACIGRRFFEITAVAFLSILVSRYKIEVLEEPQFSAETFEERKTRVVSAIGGITPTPVRVPLVFKRR